MEDRDPPSPRLRRGRTAWDEAELRRQLRSQAGAWERGKGIPLRARLRRDVLEFVARLSGEAERGQGGLVDRFGGVEAVRLLVFGQSLARQRADEAVDFPFVIALLLQRGLDIGHDLIERAAPGPE